jgi:hypothetical protein
MGKMIVEAAEPTPTPGAKAPLRAPRSEFVRGLRALLMAVASLRITVVLFALSLVLVFLGTLAQVDAGIWTVVNHYFRTGIAWIPFQVFVRFGQVFLGVPRTAQLSGSFPYPGGWLLGGLLLANLLAAHLVRFKLTWRRSGILLLHAGIIVMMVSELVTGLFAVEGNMTIEQGKASNFVEDRRHAELAVIDPANSKTDHVVAVPERLLRDGGLIRHDDLPFDVEVTRYMTNSAILREPPADAENPATAGDGRSVVAVERPEVSGTATEQTIDLPSAYVTLKKKDTGEPIGTYLVSLWLSINDRSERVTVGGKPYDVSLRFKRMYKPYTIHLIEFRHETYLGTDKPKNFSSQIRLVDPSRHEDREELIYMNHPLRYTGETFYQSSFLPGDTGTILQVVRNPGWLMPYISCAMVAVGMLVHFGLHLVEFLRRRAMA